MSLKAVLFDFNGVIINDEPLHAKLIEQILLEENLRMKPGDFRQYCLGRSDRACLSDLLIQRDRMVTEPYVNNLIARKAKAYLKAIEAMEPLPIYSGIDDLIFQLQPLDCKLAVVSGALRSEIETVLQRANLRQHFDVIVAGDDITTSKPEPDGYLLAVERLKELFPDRQIRPENCLAIEDTFAGIAAAKNAGIPVVGIANTYPYHMMQRHADWAVDYLVDLEIDRLQEQFTKSAHTAA
jgi:beta-phosphoglucomutase